MVAHKISINLQVMTLNEHFDKISVIGCSFYTVISPAVKQVAICNFNLKKHFFFQSEHVNQTGIRWNCHPALLRQCQSQYKGLHRIIEVIYKKVTSIGGYLPLSINQILNTLSHIV